MNSPNPNDAVSLACERAGGTSALARLLDVSPQLVSQWKAGKRPVSAVHCSAIEHYTGVPKQSLNRDAARIWPNEAVAAGAT